jgi:AcrR family transcriptional regulator
MNRMSQHNERNFGHDRPIDTNIAYTECILNSMPVKRISRPYRSPQRAAAADETRARLVAAACTLLSGGKDSPAFSLDGVARQAGVTRLTVYNQFQSKRGLLEAVFDDLARRGGLSELPLVFAEADPEKAIRRFVTVFCRFWTAHATMLPKFSAVTKLDDDVAASLLARTERRRHALTVLVSRLAADDENNADLVDLLFALTGFDMFAALSVRNRSAESVEALMQDLVEQTLKRYGALRSTSPRGGRSKRSRVMPHER